MTNHEIHQYRCETCKHKQLIEKGESHQGYPWFFCKDEKIPYDGRAFTKYRGCASHSDLQITEPIKYGDRRTCEYQEIETYPSDEFVYCKSAEGCKLQCLARVGSKIFCDKPIISHDVNIVQAARRDEREKVMDELKAFCKEKGTNWAYDRWTMKKLIEYVELRSSKKEEQE